MYGKRDGGGGGACAIVALWGEWGIVVLGGGVPTDNELGEGLVFNAFVEA